MKLNSFQQLMRRWTMLCPYNVGHVIQFAGSADVPRWHRAIRETIQETGLGIPQVRGDTVNFLPCGETSFVRSYADIESAVSEEINTRFSPDQLPVRFFIVDQSSGAYYLGAFFDHWIADSKSFGHVMDRIVSRYKAPATLLPRMELDSLPFRDHFDTERFYNFHAAADCVKDYIQHRRVFRVSIGDPMNFHYGCHSLQAPAGLIDHLRSTSKKWQCTVNDLFLASLFQVLGVHVSSRTGEIRHDFFRNPLEHISLGTAVDLRPFANHSTGNLLGLLVSYFSVVLKHPERIPIRDLSRNIAAVTGKIKSERTALRYFLNFRVGLMFWNLCKSRHTQAQIFHKSLSMAAAVSNENLTGSWAEAHMDDAGKKPQIINYFRVPPIGPLSPLVLMPTTLRDRLTVTVGYRATAFPLEAAYDMGIDFLERLKAI